ncbi:MAG TPA: FtsX-like permease family protein [Anaeromyxobacteraceae bacterium]|nr:FtsX-like permease family protein [Anaeromyxobacteraceae bacterium]
MIATDLSIAARNLTRHTRRNAFLGGALAAVTALLVLLGGLSAGVEASMMESATVLMTGHVNVGGFYKVTSGTAAPLVTDYQKVLAETTKHVPELEYATVRVRGWAKGVSERSSMDLVLSGVDVRNEPGFTKVVRVLSGRLEDLARPGSLLLFEDQARRLEVQVGDVITLSAPTFRGQNNTADVRVVAIAQNAGLISAFTAFLEASTLRGLYNLREGNTGAIHLYLKDPRASARVAARLRDALSAAGWRVMDANPQPYWMKLMQIVPNEDWTGQKLDMSTWEDEMSFMSWILSAVRTLSTLLVFILMVIVVIGILNTLAIAIRERTREIGTLRAIGMQRRKVLWLFLLEAFLLGVAGTALGALLGAGLGALVNAARLGVPESVQMFLLQQQLTLRIETVMVVTAVAALTLLTTLAAFLPARRAARLRPVTAMHHIG